MIKAGAGFLFFSHWQSFSFLVAATVIAAFWALLMLLVDGGLVAMGRAMHATSYLWAVLLGDFVSSTAAPLLHHCCGAASPLLRRCFTTAALLPYRCLD